MLTTPGAIDNMMAAGFPVGDMAGSLGDWLGDQNDYRTGRIAERQAAGVQPSDGPIDWNAIMYDLNAPKRERGVEFDGPVDWGGIGNAIGGAFGGIGEAFSSPAPRVVAPGRNVPTNNGGLVERNQPSGIVDPQTGFIKDPQTGTYYRPDMLPGPDRLTTEPTRSVEGLPTQAPYEAMPNVGSYDIMGPLKGLAEGVDAERRRLAGDAATSEVMPEMPRRDPRGIGAAVRPALAADPWTDPVPTDMPPSNVNPAPAKPEEPTVWDRAVDMAGSAMGNTLLGGAVKTLFPDFWEGAGDTFKGNGTMGTLGPDPFDNSSFGSGGGGGGDAYAQPFDFIDLNHNGIDDRMEGYTPPNRPAASPSQINYGSATFPNMPPYNPGVSGEWQYFRPGYAAGGLVQYAEGGAVEAAASQSPNGAPMGGLDPRITIIADAEDALTGESANPEEALALFVKSFGQDALEMLKAQVQSGMTLRGNQRKQPRMAKSRFIDGPGGGKDDQVPARIDDVKEAKLSNGEVVITADAVKAAGEGDPMKGAAKLSQLDAMLSGREHDVVNIERVR